MRTSCLGLQTNIVIVSPEVHQFHQHATMISELCIYDLSTGGVNVVLEHKGLIEAPNWHPNGYLVVNGDGLLYRVPLDAPRLERMDTGFAVKLNNDHGLSPDGKRIAISDKTLTAGSCIYIMPIDGGDPARFTEDTPSWFHGWSPDASSICYPAARGDKKKISLYTQRVLAAQIKTESGSVSAAFEMCVTDDFDHVDGPDYSADGQWIWFNGEREGHYELHFGNN
jgi:Tol biopolymer transport system component